MNSQRLALNALCAVLCATTFAQGLGAITPQIIDKAALLKMKLIDSDHEGKKLTKFPEFIDPSVIKSLNLEDNAIELVPEYIARMTNLEKLDLSENQLKTLSEKLGLLKLLKNLDLDNNQLEELPKSISQLTNLEEIELNNNKLRSLPEALGGLHKLKNLKLNGNLLTHLPNSIGLMKSLEVLLAANNDIRLVPKTIAKLQLKLLDLSGNKNLAETSSDPLFMGKKELKETFGDRVKLP